MLLNLSSRSSSCSPQLNTHAQFTAVEPNVASSFSTVYVADELGRTTIPPTLTGAIIATKTLLDVRSTTIGLPSSFPNASYGPSQGFGTASTFTSTVFGPWTTMYSTTKTVVDMTIPTLAVTDQSAIGFATIVNYCARTVYLWPVDQNRDPQMPILIPFGHAYTEQYYFPIAGGVSLKLNTENNISGNITQFEYTADHQYGGFIWYDGSNVNCVPGFCPFDQNGIHLAGNLATCASRTCAPNTSTSNSNCNGFYIQPTDDQVAMMGCSWSANVTMSLCYSDAAQA